MSNRSTLTMVHIPKFRSTRPVWLFHELRALYPHDQLPEMEILTFDDIPSFRNNKPEWLLQMNPNGKVPALEHRLDSEKVVLFEGGAICSYLLDHFDTKRKLLPKDSRSTALYHMCVSWCGGTLDNLTATSSPIQRVLCATNDDEKKRELVQNQKYFDQVAAPFLVNLLKQSTGPYLCGSEFTAADVVLGSNGLALCEKMQPPWVSPTKFPELDTYFSLVTSRPACQTACGSKNLKRKQIEPEKKE